ncbi:uncharacterized protein LOC131930203 [Physella acuta]|uniref:uncharacterized protein LOC131930203 n=1 Tax=Physella acuta TaxID=109671 RepID=UPI0027DD51D0|nr:uncharacterized protein LOC131930203 [Physella acuta]
MAWTSSFSPEFMEVLTLLTGRGLARRETWATIRLVLLTLLLCAQTVSATWSVGALERWKAEQIQKSPRPLETAERLRRSHKVALFYGNHVERQKNRVCERIKCQFLHSGCVVYSSDSPQPFRCFILLARLRQHYVGDCPYFSCEGYNGVTKCVKDVQVCEKGQGKIYDFGLCKNYEKCCLFPETTV